MLLACIAFAFFIMVCHNYAQLNPVYEGIIGWVDVGPCVDSYMQISAQVQDSVTESQAGLLL